MPMLLPLAPVGSAAPSAPRAAAVPGARPFAWELQQVDRRQPSREVASTSAPAGADARATVAPESVTEEPTAEESAEGTPVAPGVEGDLPEEPPLPLDGAVLAGPLTEVPVDRSADRFAAGAPGTGQAGAAESGAAVAMPLGGSNAGPEDGSADARDGKPALATAPTGRVAESGGSTSAVVGGAPEAGTGVREMTGPNSTAALTSSGGAERGGPAARLEEEGAEGIDRLNAARVARGLGQAALQRGGGLTLRLSPVELGQVRIELQVQGTSVQAQLQAETAGARQMLSQHLGSLRQALEAQGLSVERLTVQPLATTAAGQSGMDGEGGDGRSRGRFDQSPDQQQQQQDRSHRRGRGANDITFAQRFAAWATESSSEIASRSLS